MPDMLCTPEDEDLLHEQIRQIDGDKVQRVAILSFRALQLYRIAKLQAALVKKQNAIMNRDNDGAKVALGTEDDTEEEAVDKLLQRYGTIAADSSICH